MRTKCGMVSVTCKHGSKLRNLRFPQWCQNYAKLDMKWKSHEIRYDVMNMQLRTWHHICASNDVTSDFIEKPFGFSLVQNVAWDHKHAWSWMVSQTCIIGHGWKRWWLGVYNANQVHRWQGLGPELHATGRLYWKLWQWEGDVESGQVRDWRAKMMTAWQDWMRWWHVAAPQPSTRCVLERGCVFLFTWESTQDYAR